MIGFDFFSEGKTYYMRLLFTSLFCLLFAGIIWAQHTDTAFYSVVTSGTLAGEQKSWRIGTNEHHYVYFFNDRGRGNNAHVVVKTDNEGLITSLKASGVDYFKNPYNEHFEVVGDSAVWTINGNRKAKKFNNVWYSSGVAPGLTQLQVNWLLRQRDKKGKTLLGNVIRTEEAVVKNISLNGKSATLRLHAFYTDSLPVPYYVWFTDDMRYFASVSLWRSIIKKGHESWTDTLLVLQERAGQAYYLQQMQQFSAAVPSRLLITHATLFQSATAAVKKDMSVEVVQGKITAVYPSSENRKVKADSVIDAKGKFLMPGLWDMHAHYFKANGLWYLAGGVTHIRDMGNADISLLYKQQIAANELLGPDIRYTSGFIDRQGPYQGPVGRIVSSLEEAKKAVHELKLLGYNQIKLYSSLNPDWVAPISAEAHQLDMRVCGHIPAFMKAEQAIRDGYDELTHMNFLFLNFMEDTLDTRTPVRFRAVGDRAGSLDLTSKQVQSFIRLLKEKNVTVDATMNVFAGMFNEFKGDTSGSTKPIVRWLPASSRTNLGIQTAFGSDDKKDTYRSSFQNMLKMLKLLHDNGILLVAGTDGGQAVALHHELELYVRAGIPAREVLKIATYNAAKACGLENTYGEMKTGRAADFILIDGNPAQNISDIRQVEWVVKNGKFYNPKLLLASQGWKYYY